MRWSGSLRVTYAVVPITPNNGIAADQTVVEWPCLLAVCVPRAEMSRCTSGSMVKEGYYFGLPPLVLGGAGFLLHWYAAAVVLVLLAAFVFSFFRDPESVIPPEPGAVWAPGDGRRVLVTHEEDQ